MNRRHVILALGVTLYVLQLGLLTYAHSLAAPALQSLDMVVSAAIALALGLADWYATHYLLQALDRIEQVYAQDVSQQLQQTLEHYRQLAEREEQRAREIGLGVEAELAKAREDLAAGHAEDATKHLWLGLDIASDMKRQPCANVTVAAIMEVKARECEEAGVRLDSKIDLPQELPLKNAEVASLLFNLIDNALNECKALLAENPTHQPEITLCGRIQAGQLFIQVRNPQRHHLAGEKRIRIRPQSESQHGWGTSIVQGVAQNHGGIAEFESAGDTFIATVMIPLR